MEGKKIVTSKGEGDRRTYDPIRVEEEVVAEIFGFEEPGRVDDWNEPLYTSSQKWIADVS